MSQIVANVFGAPPSMAAKVEGQIASVMQKHERKAGHRKGYPKSPAPNQYTDGLTEFERLVLKNKGRISVARMAKLYGRTQASVIAVLEAHGEKVETKDAAEERMREDINAFVDRLRPFPNGVPVLDLPTPSHRDRKVRQRARERGLAVFKDRRWYAEKSE